MGSMLNHATARMNHKAAHQAASPSALNQGSPIEPSIETFIDDESSYDPSDDAFHYGDEYCGKYSSGDEYVDDCAEGFSGGD